MMPPRITLGIPTYNRARLLKQALDSAIAQDYPNLEILVSDNASTDETPEVCAAAKHPGLTVTRHAENRGPNQNFLYLLERASGTYFMMLADDDWLEPNYVSSCFRELEQGHVLAAGRAYCYRDGARTFDCPPIDLEEPTGAERVLSFYRQVQDNFSFYGLARTELWRDTPLHNVFGMDWHMVAQFAFRGTVRTVTSTAIHRDYNWSPERMAHLGRLLGHPIDDATRMYFWIGLGAAHEIAWSTPCYRELPLVQRVRLAQAAATTIWSRHQVLETEGSRLLNRWLPSPAVKALRGARRLLHRAV